MDSGAVAAAAGVAAAGVAAAAGAAGKRLRLVLPRSRAIQRQAIAIRHRPTASLRL
jgi:hypothetical protein